MPNSVDGSSGTSRHLAATTAPSSLRMGRVDPSCELGGAAPPLLLSTSSATTASIMAARRKGTSFVQGKRQAILNQNASTSNANTPTQAVRSATDRRGACQPIHLQQRASSSSSTVAFSSSSRRELFPSAAGSLLSPPHPSSPANTNNNNHTKSDNNTINPKVAPHTRAHQAHHGQGGGRGDGEGGGRPPSTQPSSSTLRSSSGVVPPPPPRSSSRSGLRSSSAVASIDSYVRDALPGSIAATTARVPKMAQHQRQSQRHSDDGRGGASSVTTAAVAATKPPLQSQHRRNRSVLGNSVLTTESSNNNNSGGGGGGAAATATEEGNGGGGAGRAAVNSSSRAGSKATPLSSASASSSFPHPPPQQAVISADNPYLHIPHTDTYFPAKMKEKEREQKARRAATMAGGSTTNATVHSSGGGEASLQKPPQYQGNGFYVPSSSASSARPRQLTPSSGTSAGARIHGVAPSSSSSTAGVLSAVDGAGEGAAAPSFSTAAVRDIPIRWVSIRKSNAVTARVAAAGDAAATRAAGGSGSDPAAMTSSSAMATASCPSSSTPAAHKLYYWSRNPFTGVVTAVPVLYQSGGGGGGALLCDGPSDNDIEVVLGLRAVLAEQQGRGEGDGEGSPSPSSSSAIPHPMPPLPADDLERKVWELPYAEPILGTSGASSSRSASSSSALPLRLLDYRSSVLDNNYSMDLVHCYTIARLALDVVVGDLRALGVVGASAGGGGGSHLSDGWRWQWEGRKHPPSNSPHQQLPLDAFGGNGSSSHATAVGAPAASALPSVLGRQPLRIIAHAGGLNTNNNSAYHRGKRAVKFYFNLQQQQQPQRQQQDAAGNDSGGGAAIVRVYTCRSSDIVAHEVGHAILDSLCPLFYNFRGEGEIAGLHEGFGDVIAICAAVERRDTREYAVGAILKDILLHHHDYSRRRDNLVADDGGVEVLLAGEHRGHLAGDDGGDDEDDAVRAERRALAVLGAIFGESSPASTASRRPLFSLGSPSLSFLTAIGQSYGNSTMVGISTTNLHKGAASGGGGGSSSSSSDDETSDVGGDEVDTYNSLPPSSPSSAARSARARRRFEHLLSLPNVLLTPLPSADDAAAAAASAIRAPQSSPSPSLLTFGCGCGGIVRDANNNTAGITTGSGDGVGEDAAVSASPNASLADPLFLTGSTCGLDAYVLANLFSAFIWDIISMSFDQQMKKNILHQIEPSQSAMRGGMRSTASSPSLSEDDDDGCDSDGYSGINTVRRSRDGVGRGVDRPMSWRARYKLLIASLYGGGDGHDHDTRGAADAANGADHHHHHHRQHHRRDGQSRPSNTWGVDDDVSDRAVYPLSLLSGLACEVSSIFQRVVAEVRCLLLAAIVSVYTYRTKRECVGARGLFQEISRAMGAIVEGSAKASAAGAGAGAAYGRGGGGSGRRGGRGATHSSSPRSHTSPPPSSPPPPMVTAAMITLCAERRELGAAGRPRGEARQEVMRRLMGDI